MLRRLITPGCKVIHRFPTRALQRRLKYLNATIPSNQMSSIPKGNDLEKTPKKELKNSLVSRAMPTNLQISMNINEYH